MRSPLAKFQFGTELLCSLFCSLWMALEIKPDLNWVSTRNTTVSLTTVKDTCVIWGYQPKIRAPFILMEA